MTFALTGAFQVDPADRDALVALLLQAAELLGQDDRCLLYAVSTTEQPGEVAVVELWTDEQAHSASLQLPGVGELIAQARPLITGLAFRHAMQVVGGKVA